MNEKILAYIKNNPECNTSEIANNLDIDLTVVYLLIDQLIQDKILIRKKTWFSGNKIMLN